MIEEKDVVVVNVPSLKEALESCSELIDGGHEWIIIDGIEDMAQADQEPVTKFLAHYSRKLCPWREDFETTMRELLDDIANDELAEDEETHTSG